MAPEEEVPNDGITGWLGTFFARPDSVRIAVDGLAELELRWGWYLGKGGWRDAARALHAKKGRTGSAAAASRRNGAAGAESVRRAGLSLESEGGVAFGEATRWRLVVWPAVAQDPGGRHRNQRQACGNQR